VSYLSAASTKSSTIDVMALSLVAIVFQRQTGVSSGVPSVAEFIACSASRNGCVVGTAEHIRFSLPSRVADSCLAESFCQGVFLTCRLGTAVHVRDKSVSRLFFLACSFVHLEKAREIHLIGDLVTNYSG